MKGLKFPVYLAAVLLFSGCQGVKQMTHDGRASIFRPELWLKDDGLYYTAGTEAPYTGKHEAWYASGDKAWEGEMKDGVRHGLYTQWHPRDGVRHVAGLYENGYRNGKWGQWYPSGHPEIAAVYLEGVESKVTFYSERGAIVSERVYWDSIQRKLNQQTWKSDPSYASSFYYHRGSNDWTPPGGGSWSDFRSLSGNRSNSGLGTSSSGGFTGGGGSSGGDYGGAASVSAPEGGSSGSPNTP